MRPIYNNNIYDLHFNPESGVEYEGVKATEGVAGIVAPAVPKIEAEPELLDKPEYPV